MAISPVTQTNVTAVASNAAVTPVNKEATQSKPQPTATDTVQISSAGKAALQEATETPVQTAKKPAVAIFRLSAYKRERLLLRKQKNHLQLRLRKHRGHRKYRQRR